MSEIFETALIEFYENASVRDDKVVSTVRGKLVEISEEVFARTFQLPVEGLIDISEQELKIEYRLLSDIVAKSITVKSGTFDAVTHERFLFMTAIFGGVSVNCGILLFKIFKDMVTPETRQARGVSVNCGILLFKIFKDMVTPETRQARGYAVLICILLNNIPDLELGDSEEFPPLKILTAKTVGRYISINEKIAVDSVEGLAGKSRVKKTLVKRAISKKRSAADIDEQIVKKKRTLMGKAAPSKAKLELVSIALDAEPIQIVDPTSADDVDSIIEQVVTETTRMDTDEELETSAFETNVETQRLKTFLEPEAAKGTEMGTVLKDPVVTQSDNILVEVTESPAATTAKEIVLAPVTDVEQLSSDEEKMSIDDLLKRILGDMMLPSILAAEPTKIKFGLGISIPAVANGDL
ncbi:hypothetical protein F511_36235 [Dorcoceras hygrometricum]|uniref:Splicing factor 3B subunit 1-like n=1 Tax=Dorcoceras hygrometricum TaxID=472368 RepID=A0A2Z7A3W9_9LAMI|nr:hypothetical protein F511_36235 [Dorcoceras hygrometricum]